MTQTTTRTQEFLATVAPFSQLPSQRIARLSEQVQVFRYRVGQPIVIPEQLPLQISILMQGQARSLGKVDQDLVTLDRLEPGAIIGWNSHLRGVPGELVIASVESICLNLPATEFLQLIKQDLQFANFFQTQATRSEILQIVNSICDRQAIVIPDIANTLPSLDQVAVLTIPPHQKPQSLQTSNHAWFLSGGSLDDFALNERVLTAKKSGPSGARLLGIPQNYLTLLNLNTAKTTITDHTSAHSDDNNHAIATIPYAPEITAPNQPEIAQRYPAIRGSGPIDATLACLQMIAQSLGVPFRREMVKRIVDNHVKADQQLSLQFCGAVAESLGLTSQMIRLPAKSIGRIPLPAMIQWQDNFAVIYHANDRQIVLGTPNHGIQRKKRAEFIKVWGEEGDAVLLKTTHFTPKQRFGLGWFVPSLIRYRRVLIEVVIASACVQMIGLVNPIITQVIIDRVLNQNSRDAMMVLGVFLLVVSIIEGILTNVRTQLFTDTSNRIDLTLGSEVINHLLRLPLSFFEKRPVGELATRMSELETIRQFLTGTALTAVLDALFAFIYIGVMVFYSPLLSVVALITIPLFAALTLTASPIIRKRAQRRAEKYSATNSYLVETLSGIQTVKAQNLELRSRWQWQERYASYISAGFQSASAQTMAGSMSGFLNKLSGLLVLWVGALLVMDGKLSLGQLIAFRMIASYATSPLLRLVQIWQNFQETSLSLQRLGDILDSPQEQDEQQQSNILMPPIDGHVRYEDVSFSFREGGALQLANINLDIAPGSFVGVVGQSGSGKSTLTKLIPRLYETNSGKVIIDDYNISKVELYSLRQQVGVVLQDTLLFDGTIRDNIALANPDASDEQIIAAAKVAYAHDFIMALPNGYSTSVGERGSSLSGGQRQRIAIARTVLQNPRLLILDEATSALDYNAERQVCLNLMAALKGRTVFFITHRLTTIRNADLILMMDQGRIIEKGTYEELMAMRGAFYCLEQQAVQS
jgi:ATP-binding cassette, subfamily B, bacterial HlyB/CyaB